MTNSSAHSSIEKHVSIENQRTFYSSISTFSIGNVKSYIADNLIVMAILVIFEIGFTTFFVFYKNDKSPRFSPTSIKTQQATPCNTHF